jgi:uncharacterized membrane protein YjfL (UPF0719 family)
MLRPLAFAAGTMALLLLAWRAFRAVAGGRRGALNAAGAVVEAGEVLGVFLVVAGAASGAGHGYGLVDDAVHVLEFGVVGVTAFLLAGGLGINLLLRGRLAAEIARGNVAAGVAACGHFIATGVIAASLFNSRDFAGLDVACVFFVASQVTLHVLVLLFRALTTYDDVEHILDENMAAALSYAGVAVAVGILVADAADGPFMGFAEGFRKYGAALLVGLALYPVRQILVQCVILGAPPTYRGGKLDDGIAKERNVGLGALEAATYVATALVVRSFS